LQDSAHRRRRKRHFSGTRGIRAFTGCKSRYHPRPDLYPDDEGFHRRATGIVERGYRRLADQGVRTRNSFITALVPATSCVTLPPLPDTGVPMLFKLFEASKVSRSSI